jgi:SAM-dependent methyltransferase
MELERLLAVFGNRGSGGLRATLAGGLEERLAAFTPSRRLRLALAEATIGELAGGGPLRVLDAGCGDGLLSLALAKRHPGWELVGLDFSDSLLERARHRAAARSLSNVRFAQANLTEPLAEGGFDVAMAIECLTEIPEDRRALLQIVRSVRPGGLVVVHVPRRNWRPVLPGSAATWRDEVRHGYGADQLTAMLREAGLEQIQVTPTYHSLAAMAQEVRDRIKGWPLPPRALLLPPLVGAASLERRGLEWGAPNALLAAGRAAATVEPAIPEPDHA